MILPATGEPLSYTMTVLLDLASARLQRRLPRPAYCRLGLSAPSWRGLTSMPCLFWVSRQSIAL